MRVIDVSMPIRDGMAGFPGDPPVVVRNVRRVADGDPYSLSALRLSSHTGTHLDPPSHFIAGGASIDELDVERFNGAAAVVELADGVPSIDAEVVAGLPNGSERVLFRTSNSARWGAGNGFFPDYVALERSGAQALLARGVRLVGIDSLSIERDSTGTFPVHHALLGGGALILEGLVLSGAVAGNYELQCLPLRIAAGDGGPCRAVLRPA